MYLQKIKKNEIEKCLYIITTKKWIRTNLILKT